jgi:hypothetical protein
MTDAIRLTLDRSLYKNWPGQIRAFQELFPIVENQLLVQHVVMVSWSQTSADLGKAA